MICKSVKLGSMVVLGAFVVGALAFGTDLMSYVHSSFKSVRQTVKKQVSVEFELQRAYVSTRCRRRASRPQATQRFL